MCGHAGFARNPNADPETLDYALGIFSDLMAEIGYRGRHATGFAALHDDGDIIWKRAAPVDLVLKSDAWGEAVNALPNSTRAVIGHVRHATLANARLDEAAHPFKHGAVIGAHNGIIYNWRKVASDLKRDDLIVDSEVAFVLLNNEKRATRALDPLDGYWALVWAKGQSIFMCRTNDAPLACAYVFGMRTLFWCSDRLRLERVLDDAKVGKYESWDLSSHMIYRWTPTKFDDTSTYPDKQKAAFRGLSPIRTRGGFNSARPPAFDDDTPYSTTKAVTTYSPTTARLLPTQGELDAAAKRAAKASGSPAQLTLAAIVERLARVETALVSMMRTQSDLIEQLDASGMIDTEALTAFKRSHAAHKHQTALALGLDVATCRDCEGEEDASPGGKLLSVPGEGFVHVRCVMRDPTGGETTRQPVKIGEIA